MRFILLFLMLTGLLSGPVCQAQIGMGGPPDPSAVLNAQSSSNNKGLLIPRLTTV